MTVPRPARKPGGKPSLAVPHLRAKLDYLLARDNRPVKWLSQVLASPSGGSPTPQAVGMWKVSGKVPLDYMASLAFVFGIDRAILEMADLEAFRAAAAAAAPPGSGRYWRRLGEEALETSEGLVLVREHGDARPRVGNLGFARPAARPRLTMAEVPADEGIRFMLPDTALAPLRRHAPAAPSFLLCCEDRLGWKTLCPSSRDRGFALAGGSWSLPGGEDRFLYVEEGLGRFCAIAVAYAGACPRPILDALISGRAEWGMDALAAWLFESATPHLVFQRQFLVTVPRGRR